MLNFYESFACGQATCEVMTKIEPQIEAVEKAVIRLAAPVGLSVLIAAHPVAAPLATEVKNLLTKSPTSQIRTEEPRIDGLVLTVQTAETQKPPLQQAPKPSYVPGLWNLIAATTGASGDMVQTYMACSPVERCLQKISAPDWIHEESSLPNQPAPAYFGIRIA